MSYFQPTSGYGADGPPPYQSSSLSPQKSAGSVQANVNLALNQRVEIRLDVNSPWIVGWVLAVFNVAEKSFAFEYQIKFQAGGYAVTKIFPENSPNIRAIQ
ncbi:hypothetical protein B0H13DRAFT_2306228 [Mycena leptocephala]|nr:hypothetical protein B0H13DRAFT_2306228 [Mycena leptocephala]